MFSATLHSAEVKRLAAAICQQPMLVDLKGKDAVPDTVDHVLLRVDPTGDATWLQSTPKVGVLAGSVLFPLWWGEGEGAGAV
jgi:ATP-dependent RNA helicase DDX1